MSEKTNAEYLAEKQITFEDYVSNIPKAARGETCEAQDTPRLNEQAMRIYSAMRDLRPWTLREISNQTGDPEASVSARIREIRKYLQAGGKGTIIRERVEGGNGVHTYVMRLNAYFGAA